MHALRTVAAITLPALLAILVARVGLAALEPLVAPAALAVLVGVLAYMFGPEIRRTLRERGPESMDPYRQRRRRRERRFYHDPGNRDDR